MEPIVRWFQGTSMCGGIRPKEMIEDGEGRILCLALATLDNVELLRLSGIIDRLFPERACSCPHVHENVAWTRVVHFNNNVLTTRGDVDRILHTYHLDYA